MALLSHYLTFLKRCWIGQVIFRPGKCQGQGVFERSAFQIVVTCFLLGTFAPASVAGETPLSACRGKHEGKVTDKSITRRYDQGVGFNPSQYIIQPYTSSPWPATSTDLEKRREKFETDKLKEFVRTRGAAMLDAPAVVDLVERNGLSATGRSGDTALRTAVRVYEERADIDCRTGDYIYSVEFLLPKNPLQLLSYPLRAALEDALDQNLGQAFSGPVLNDGITFRINDIVEQIRRTLAANQRVISDANKPDAALRLLHARFRELFPIDSGTKQEPPRAYTFGVGEYRLSPGMTYIIEQIVRRLLRRSESEQGRFDLVVRGYADASPVREIPYEGTCDIGSRSNVLTELTATPRGDRSGPSFITSNWQLSIARACEGARLAKELIPPGQAVRVFYSGGGVIAGAPQETYRGIELQLERGL